MNSAIAILRPALAGAALQKIKRPYLVKIKAAGCAQEERVIRAACSCDAITQAMDEAFIAGAMPTGALTVCAAPMHAANAEEAM